MDALYRCPHQEDARARRFSPAPWRVEQLGTSCRSDPRARDAMPGTKECAPREAWRRSRRSFWRSGGHLKLFWTHPCCTRTRWTFQEVSATVRNLAVSTVDHCTESRVLQPAASRGHLHLVHSPPRGAVECHVREHDLQRQERRSSEYAATSAIRLWCTILTATSSSS